MPIIGLTGNFGMGKSTVLMLFNKLGAFTLSADQFVNKMLEAPEIIRKIARVLGADIMLDGPDNLYIDKKRVADIIFNDPRKRKAVEKIIHPLVLKRIKQSTSELLTDDPSATIVVEVPLLFEAGYTRLFDKTIVVFCNRDAALSRLTGKGYSRSEAVKIMRAQMPIAEKKKLADFLIDNNNGLKNTGSQVKKIFKDLSPA
ncbi:MAG: dephospho-CoA kinase [Nitrospirae bacterium]|nr:dephospho-CoA kinase [Nitrospirota bacterium]